MREIFKPEPGQDSDPGRVFYTITADDVGKGVIETTIGPVSLHDVIGRDICITGGSWAGHTGRIEHLNKTGSYKVRLNTLPGLTGRLVTVQPDEAEPAGAHPAGETAPAYAYIAVEIRVPADLRHDNDVAANIAVAAQEYANETYGRKN